MCLYSPFSKFLFYLPIPVYILKNIAYIYYIWIIIFTTSITKTLYPWWRMGIQSVGISWLGCVTRWNLWRAGAIPSLDCSPPHPGRHLDPLVQWVWRLRHMVTVRVWFWVVDEHCRCVPNISQNARSVLFAFCWGWTNYDIYIILCNI